MRTLVIVKGQLRTWHESKDILKSYLAEVVEKTKLRNSDRLFFENHEVDVLMMCWDVSYQLYLEPYDISYVVKENVNEEEISKFFADSNVISSAHFEKISFLETYEMFEKSQFHLEEEYHLPCYLTYRAGLAKRKLEIAKGFDYDYVLEIRPDVFYAPKTASKILKDPQFGEILCLHGNNVLNIHGIVSPMTEDLIFFMSGATYNLFSKEIFFHFRNKFNSIDYTTAHVEKNMYFRSSNFQLNDMGNALCSFAIILRPTIDWQRYWSIDDYVERLGYLRHVDAHWRMNKNIQLEAFLKTGKTLEEIVAFKSSKSLLNLNKIKETLLN